MENSSGISREDEQMELPPGFRFHPTDEELITHYLCQKVVNSRFNAIAIGDADLNKVEPWDLPRMAKMGEKEWYFFCVRDRKYPTGMRTNRATESGYWKATGKDKEIYRAKMLVGMKKTLVFYTGRAPKGEKTNWVMHEYRLEGKYSKSNLPKTAQNEWVICRVFEKSSGGKNPNDVPGFVSLGEVHQPCLPPLMDSSSPYNITETKVMVANPPHVTCFSNQDLVGKDKKITTNTTLTETATQEDRAMMSPLMDQNIVDFQFMDSVFMQDQSILKVLLEGKGSSKVGFSQETELSCGDGEMNNHLSNYGMVENSDGPIDLDCLWDY